MTSSSPITREPSPGPATAWLLAARPKTLGAGVAPVVMGTALAYGDGVLYWPAAFCALAGCLLIQVGTNFANDYFDFAKGTDTAGRLGPMRVTQAGLIAPGLMKWATAFVYAAAVLPGAYIVWRGGWPFVIIGVVSILCGVFYTAGPRPLGYIGLGDLFVLVFFGPVAVGGTYYVQGLSMDGGVLIAGLAPGLLSVALLTVNNLRDIEEDRAAGKRTLAVRFGRAFARGEYLVCVLAGAGAVPVYLGVVMGNRWFMVCPFVAAVLAAPLVRTVLTTTDGAALNGALAGTGRLLLVFSLVFGAACVL